MSFGRSTRQGPIGSFAEATSRRFGRGTPGKVLGAFPVLVSLAMTIGYSVVVGWICKYTFDAFAGTNAGLASAEQFGAVFEGIAAGNPFWQVVGVAVTITILIFGVSKGIERANDVMMPLFFLLFVGLAIYVTSLPGSEAGYAYIFRFDPAGLADPMIWLFALGQAFFSLSIAGCGTLIYGSYFSDSENVPFSAGMVALFDTMAALLASLVIIPAMATAGQQLSSGGPGLLFIYLPAIFAGMPGGNILLVVFFVAVLFGGISSLVNLSEAPIASLQELFGLSRRAACLVIGGIVLVVGLCIQLLVSDWMDVCTTYLCPVGAFLAGVMFFWFMGKDKVLEEVNKGREKPLGAWFYPLAKYVFCGVTLVVLVAGSILGGIG
jgi:NSS family neurotransmitter:Na+ symporter